VELVVVTLSKLLYRQGVTKGSVLFTKYFKEASTQSTATLAT